MSFKKNQHSQKKPKNGSLASFLYEDRFLSGKYVKKNTNKKSVVEYTGLALLKEKLETKNRQISIDNKEVNDFLESYDYSLPIPPRIPFIRLPKDIYKEVELVAFNYWKCCQKVEIFERNLETWRQLWLTCERSDIIVQVIDARNIKKLFEDSILQLYPEKRHVILCNKCDLIDNFEFFKKTVSEYFNDLKIEIYFYSSKDPSYNFSCGFKGTVGLIGYPNVGKSSTINSIILSLGLKVKSVKVSATPGMTKHIQTITLPGYEILDCPGLVFPKYSKVDLILMGVINIEQVSNLMKLERPIIEKIGYEHLTKKYSLSNVITQKRDILREISFVRRLEQSICLKDIILDFIQNKKF